MQKVKLLARFSLSHRYHRGTDIIGVIRESTKELHVWDFSIGLLRVDELIMIVDVSIHICVPTRNFLDRFPFYLYILFNNTARRVT